ncbi:DUF4097 family beta strand repeat protein [candidate division KSB1 bacterium]|nr:DUF4097 family beta strand repeat protein [candidate division KSB1 bacterium]
MKRLTLAISFVLIAAASTLAQKLQGSSGNFYATIQKSFDVSAGGSIVIKEVPGDFEVTGWDKNVVDITQEIKIKSFTKGEAEEIFRRANAAYTQTGNKIRIDGDYSGHRVHNSFVINVPATFDVTIGTSGGDITLAKTEGEIELSTSGGDITISNTSGRTRASTSGGDLSFSDVSGTISGSTSGGDIALQNIYGEGTFTTSGGDIVVRNATDKIKLNTSGGDIRVEDVSGDVGANTSGGNILVRKVGGRCSVNTSGGDIELYDIGGAMNANTSGGDIKGENFMESISVNTSGGDIDLDNVQGEVKGNTSGGDIDVVVTLQDFSKAHGVSLKTSGGDIRLTIPEDLPATVIAEIRTSRRNYEAKRYDIYSDFPLTKTKPEEHGEVVIRSEGDINGGGDTISLETSGGDIYIKKGDK